MIAPLVRRPPMLREHSTQIRREENRVPRRVERMIQTRPVAAVTVAVVFGAALGWLVKRKQW